MRDQLLGYLLGALEQEEHELVDNQLRCDPRLQHDLDLLRRGVAPLAFDRESYEVPLGLAARTCQLIPDRPQPLPLWGWGAPAHRWGMQDLLVAAGICVAATLLFFPAVSHSRSQAQLAMCQNNLRLLGVALGNYSEHHGRFFPFQHGPGAATVTSAVTPVLQESGFLDDLRCVICPASALGGNDESPRTGVDAVGQVARREWDRLRHLVSDSYGFTLGHLADGVYHAPRNRQRAHFALAADLPSSQAADLQSSNHGGCGQNVLYEDGHVDFLKSCRTNRPEHCDNIFLNDDNAVGPGVHADDAVITHGAVPFAVPAVP